MSLARRIFLIVPTFLATLLLSGPARADSQDIAAASRSVVRVALVATDGDSAYFVGHGSGVVVAPGKVLTNAHVVELTRSEPNIVIGIIPAEGRRSYGGRVIAFSPGNDLALVSYDPNAYLPVATFFSGAPQDGEDVTAIGYPGSVDRAQGMSLQDIIHPMSPIRTSGTISTGRQSKQFETILHTAPLATGNSGGPLVDSCGRVLGINSFGSVSDGSDAAYGFAVSNREIANFLRQAGVQPQRSIEPCRSLAEIEAAQKIADEQAKAQAAARASQEELAAREAALADREQAQQSLIARRENMMAIAALLLAVAAVTGTSAVLSASRKGSRTTLLASIAGVFLVAAILAFFLRPSFDSLSEEEVANAGEAQANETEPVSTVIVGDNFCRIDPDLSRITVSDTADTGFHWNGGGCLDAETQMIRRGTGWERLVVPETEAAIVLRRFDPETRTYRLDKFQVSSDTAEQARKLRNGLEWSGCTADPARIAELTNLQAEIAALLPAQPNERLIYHCQAGKVMPAPKTGTESP